MSRERLNSVLNRFTANNVMLRKTQKIQALEFWQPIVEHIVDYVKRDDRFASIQILPKGSYYDRTKVSEPDEFDLMLVMDNLELDADPYEDDENDGMSEPPTGESYIQVQSAKGTHRNLLLKLRFHPDNHLVQHNKQDYKKVLLSSFKLNGHTSGFYPRHRLKS